MAELADEHVLARMPADLLWMSEDGSAWQEQGSGIVHFVQSRHDSSVRVMMHHASKRSAGAQLDLLLNHPVTRPSRASVSSEAERNLVTRVPMHRAPPRASGGEADGGETDLFCAYLAADYSRGSQENRVVALRFDTAHTAKEFERMLDSCLHGAAHSRGSAPPQPAKAEAEAKRKEEAAAQQKAAAEAKAQEEALERAIASGDAGAVVVKRMREHAASAAIQRKGCEALGDLSAKSAENRTLIAQVGGLEALVTAMQGHAADPAVQEWACRALGSLAVNPENQGKIPNLGGIEALLKAMKDHPAHPGVQHYACWALKNLATNPKNRVKLSNLGGIEALLKAMKDHPAHPGVQENACLALFNLSLVAENKVKISALGAEEPVRRAMAAANATENTKKWGQMLLDKLAQC